MLGFLKKLLYDWSASCSSFSQLFPSLHFIHPALQLNQFDQSLRQLFFPPIRLFIEHLNKLIRKEDSQESRQEFVLPKITLLRGDCGFFKEEREI